MSNLRYMTDNLVTADTEFVESPALESDLPAGNLADPRRALVARTTSLADQSIAGGLAIVGDGGLCDNPDFETDTTGWAANGTASIARVTSDSKFGGACLEITAGSANGTDRALYSVPVPTLAAGTPYTVTLWTKEVVGTSRQAMMGLWETGGAEASTYAAVDNGLVTDNDWTEHSINGAVVEAGRTAIQFYVGYQVDGQAISDKLLVDGVQIHVGASNPPFYPTFNCALLWGHNLSSNAMWRLALSQDTAYGAGAGNVYQSDWETAWAARGLFDEWPAERRFSVLYFADVENARSFQLELTDPANPDGYLQISELWLGEYTELGFNFDWAPDLLEGDASTHQRSRGGGGFRKNVATVPWREIKLSLSHLSAAEAQDWGDISRNNGRFWVDMYPDNADAVLTRDHAMIAQLKARQPRNRVRTLRHRLKATLTED